MNKRFAVLNITSEALNYWQNELGNRSDSTKDLYLRHFEKFLNYQGKTADELIQERAEDQTNKDVKIQRRIESQLIQFLRETRQNGYSPATLQTIYAAVKSFFEIHYFPLRMRRGDYPKGESIGVRAATKDMIQKALIQTKTRNKYETKAVILFLKDSGLRVSDARNLNYGDIQKQLESGAKIISITVVTQKSKIIAKTFIGEEAIAALKTYLTTRRKGNRNLPPEEITNDSPLFRTWESHTAQRIPRSTMSNVVRNAFMRIDEPAISAHSLRKFLQTSLEAAGVNVNWIDQMLGHRLINSRDAYSKPTDEQLKEAYTKAYKFLRVYPDLSATKQEETCKPLETQIKTSPPTVTATEETYRVAEARNMEEVKKLLAFGYKYEMEMEGVKLFVKK